MGITRPATDKCAVPGAINVSKALDYMGITDTSH